jgi:hypothetical protein
MKVQLRTHTCGTCTCTYLLLAFLQSSVQSELEDHENKTSLILQTETHHNHWRHNDGAYLQRMHFRVRSSSTTKLLKRLVSKRFRNVVLSIILGLKQHWTTTLFAIVIANHQPPTTTKYGHYQHHTTTTKVPHCT